MAAAINGKRNGWTRVAFSDIALNVTDRVDDPSLAGVDRYVGLEHLDPGSLRISRWGSPSDVEATKLRFKPGDVIFGKRRAYQRKLALADFEGICSAHAMVLRSSSSCILPEFLPVLMQSEAFHRRALAISVGSLSPTINWRSLAKEEFDLPPLHEQRRIVGVCSAIASAEACLGSAFSVLRLTHGASVQEFLECHASDSHEASLGDLFEIGGDRIDPMTAPATRYLGLEHLESGARSPLIGGNGSDVASQKSCFNDGDVLFGKIRPYLRKVALADSDGICSTDILVIRPSEVIANETEFLYQILSSELVTSHAVRMSTGTKMPRVSAENLGRLKVQIPTKPERDEFVARARALSDLGIKLQNRVQVARALRSRLLQRLLTTHNTGTDAP